MPAVLNMPASSLSTAGGIECVPKPGFCTAEAASMLSKDREIGKKHEFRLALPTEIDRFIMVTKR